MSKTKIVLALSILLLSSLACNALVPESKSNAETPQVEQSSSNSALPPSAEPIKRVSLEDAKAALENGTAVIVDVRSPEDFAASHISGAVNIPLELVEADPASIDLEENKWIITYCT
jgi:3-mercaptopyruvate sulfurtransferase SseA